MGGNDGGNVLLADRQSDLREQPAEFNRHHTSDQLVAPADLAKISPPRFNVSVTQLFRKQAVDIALRHAMVASRCFYRLDLSVIDPLFQVGIADAENVGGFPGRQELLHDRPPANLQNTAFIAASSIRLYTIRRLVVLIAQGFSGFQRMRDPLLCFLFAAEGDEGFAFEVENVLFADQLWRGQRPAGKDVRKLAAYVCVI